MTLFDNFWRFLVGYSFQMVGYTFLINWTLLSFNNSTLFDFIWLYLTKCMWNVWTCMYMYGHVCTCMYMYVHVCTYMYMYVCVCVCMYVHVCMRVWMYVCMYFWFHPFPPLFIYNTMNFFIPLYTLKLQVASSSCSGRLASASRRWTLMP